MDLKRNFLIAGLAVVSYLLLLAWNEDYSSQPVPVDSSNSSPVEFTESATNDLPQANSDTSADIPEANTTENNQQDIVLATPGNNIIYVDTPVHQVVIDLAGGDITNLTLPEYPIALQTPDIPFTLLSNNSTVYISQSGLIGSNGPDGSSNGRPVYTASSERYLLEEGQEDLAVDLVYTDEQGANITKRFIFSANDYLIDVQYIIENNTDAVWNANLFGQIKRDGSEDPSSSTGLGMKNYLGAVLTVPDDNYKKVDFDDIDKGGTNDTVDGGWIGFSQHYFISAWIPDSTWTNSYTTRKNSSGEYLIGFVGPQFSVPANSSHTIEAGFWAGPKDQYRLEEISPNLGLTIDYGFLWFIAQPVFWLLSTINNFLGNFGWSIIAMTLVIKVIFSPLSAASYRSMAKMRRLAPKINQLKEMYGDDKQKIMQEQMALWKKEKVNPLGGCLPMLLQMPVLIGIYWVLIESVELRQAPFLLWYSDLSVSDPYFVLPLIMGLSMFISQSMTPMTTADPMQAKIMKFMPVIFTVFFLWFPSGLVLYWLVSNVFNIAQQFFINKQVDRLYEKKKA